MLCPRCGSEAPDWSERCENCGLALIETKSGIAVRGPFRIGDVVAERYDVRERVAVEPIYWTYAAFDLELERPVMMRAIRRTILPRSMDHQAFVRRLQPLTTFELPGVSCLIRLDRDDGISLVISDLIDGLSLRSLIDLRRQDSRAFSALETITVLTLTAEALEAAAPVTHHGDLRPSNILIRDDELFVEAFGVAAALPWEESVRALKDSPSSRAYLAPEVLEAQFSDSRSDIYSLAVIACELLTGRVPPLDASLLEGYLDHLPPMTGDIVSRALAPDATRRDAAPTELVEALAVVLGVEPLRPARHILSIDTGRPVGASADVTVEVIRDDEGTRPFEHPGAPRSQSEVPKDPRVPVEAAAEGTQQITEDMLQPFDVVETEPRQAPIASVDMASEESRQLTEEMVRPSEAHPQALLEPQDVSAVPFEESEVESRRSLGLDPRLVRAARRLDIERDENSPTLRRPSMTPLEAAGVLDEVDALPFPEMLSPKVTYKPTPPPGFLPRQRVGADRPTLSEPEPSASPRDGLEHPTLRYSPPSPQELDRVGERSPAPFEAPEITDIEPEPEITETTPMPVHESPWPEPVAVDEPEPAPSFEVVSIPSAFHGSSLGPIQEKVSGGEVFSSLNLAEPQAFEEPEALPAVVIDDALADAFGPARPADEPTYRVERPKELLGDTTIRSAPPPPAPKASAWRLIVPIALLGGVLLAVLVALGFWMIVGS